MTLSEISYSIYEEIRQGHLVDDERLSIRLIDSWVNIKRAEYLKGLIDKGIEAPENATQDFDIAISNVVENNIDYIVSTNEIPLPIDTKYGSAIKEVASLDFNQYNFTLVNNNHFKMAGNGKFYANAIFVTYFKDKLYFKSSNSALKTIEECRVTGIFEDPTKVPGFDVDNDDYPISIQGIDDIKKSIFSMDIRMFFSGTEDEISDSSGEIRR